MGLPMFIVLDIILGLVSILALGLSLFWEAATLLNQLLPVVL